MNDLVSSSGSSYIPLNDKRVLESLLVGGIQNKYISDTDISNIQTECINILYGLLEQYYGENGSSVREEVALKIMSSIVYTIGLAIKKRVHQGESYHSILRTKMAVLYIEGGQLIDALINDIKALLCEIEKTRIPFYNIYYGAMPNYITTSLDRYQKVLSADDINFLPDYLIENPSNKYIGIEEVIVYARSFLSENKICRLYSNEAINEIQNRFDELDNESHCNFFHYMKRFLLTRIIIGKPYFSIEFSLEELQKLKNLILSRSASYLQSMFIKILLPKFVRDTGAFLGQKDYDYIKRSFVSYINEIKNEVNKENLLGFFYPQNDGNSELVFVSNNSLFPNEYNHLLNQLKKLHDFSQKKKLLISYSLSPSDFVSIIYELYFSQDDICELLDEIDNDSLAVLLKYCEQQLEYENGDKKNILNTISVNIQKILNDIGDIERERLLWLLDNL